MQVKLKKHGANSHAIVIPKAILELYKIDKDTLFEIKPGENSFSITISADPLSISQVMAEIDEERAPLFQSLAKK